MEIGRKCEYLAHYDKIFVEGDFEIKLNKFHLIAINSSFILIQ
jgi:hypothetical protein